MGLSYPNPRASSVLPRHIYTKELSLISATHRISVTDLHCLKIDELRANGLSLARLSRVSCVPYHALQRALALGYGYGNLTPDQQTAVKAALFQLGILTSSNPTKEPAS